MSTDQSQTYAMVLCWQRSDIEQRFGFSGGKYTDVNNRLSLVLGVCFCLLLYLGLFLWRQNIVASIFIERGKVPYFISMFSCWSLAILFLKWRKLALQRKALGLMVVPQASDFVLAPATASLVLQRMKGLVDNPLHFVLLNRVELALSNLSNIGRVSDVSEILSTQAQNDEDHMESSYSFIRGFVWGIPVLGFIGTVLGLSDAIGKFGGVLAKTTDVASLTQSLQQVTAGLSVAFDTTLLGLIAALSIQLLMTVLKKKEEDFLHDCKEYCHANIVGKLRLIHLSDEEEHDQALLPGE